MKPAASIILLLYIGYATGSLQVLAFPDKYEVIGVLLGVSILLVIIAGVMNGARNKKSTRTIPKRSSAVSSAKKRSKAKSSAKVVKS